MKEILKIKKYSNNDYSTKHFYNEKGFLVRIECSDGTSCEFFYDEHDNVVLEKNYDGEEVRYYYEYDSNGNIIKYIDNYGDVREYEYDSKNRIVKLVCGDITEINRFNDNGDVVYYLKIYGGDKKVGESQVYEEHIYEYDGTKLIKETINENNGYHEIIEYEYY